MDPDRSLALLLDTALTILRGDDTRVPLHLYRRISDIRGQIDAAVDALTGA
jgi:hypothetical protein